jgi:trans-aconitate methyltransferase
LAVTDTGDPQTWVDLGCGAGTFTSAIASLLPSKSIVYAIDRDPQLFPESVNDVSIRFSQGDFEKEKFSFTALNGVLLANSLHYVSDQVQVITKLATWLHPHNGRFLLVEYDSKTSNQWVPYPIPFQKVATLFSGAGFVNIEKIGERKSRYGQGIMYACVVKK